MSASAGSGAHVSISPGGSGLASVDKNSPQFVSAQKACARLLPGGNETPAETAQARVAELAVARCMRSHGYPNFPDPTSQGMLILSNADFNPQSPEFQSAMQTCGNAKGARGGPIRAFIGPPGATPP